MHNRFILLHNIFKIRCFLGEKKVLEKRLCTKQKNMYKGFKTMAFVIYN